LSSFPTILYTFTCTSRLCIRHRKALLVIAILLFCILPAAAAVPPGRITVYSTPSGANACIDNKNCDITPATFAVEGNAWHMIVVTEKGYHDWIETVYVTSDQTRMVTAYLDLDPAATAIRVNVTPGGGIICLDNSQCRADSGNVNTTATTLFTGVSPGYHTISVESPAGYIDTTKLVHVNLGKITEVTIALEAFNPPPTTVPTTVPATGMVRVYVDRTGSTICIDNARCMYNVGGSPGPGTGTIVFNHVIANETHIITVAADGYEPFSAPVTVGRDLIAKVDVTLRPIAGATTVLTTAPSPVTTIPVTTQATPVPSSTVLSTPVPIPTKSNPDTAPVIGALVLCGIVFMFRKNRK
jgi:hypothetical protein